MQSINLNCFQIIEQLNSTTQEFVFTAFNFSGIEMAFTLTEKVLFCVLNLVLGKRLPVPRDTNDL